MVDIQKQRSLFSDNDESDLFFYERRLYAKSCYSIAGIDEAGRGPLAGPVVAAAVILPRGVDLPGVDDSKKLAEAKRDKLFTEIMGKALAVGVGKAEADEIDEINILQATLKAMKRAVDSLSITPDYLLIDGINTIKKDIPQEAIKKGDSRSISIAAASIIAKVTRDRLMVELDKQFPAYGFASHKGYGSKTHREAIASCGPVSAHRKSFAGVKEHVK
ncbi:MAG: ribonuclease HII [Deltaproteobacteria bacterium]|nr:ribonuclease HII [Deltaproteobacteria bacterium]